MTPLQTDHLYRRWQGYLLTVAYRILGDWYLSEDAVQDSFIKIAGKDLMLPSSEDQRKYLGRIVRNECIDKVRVSGRMKIEPVECLTNEQVNEQIDRELCWSIVDKLIEKYLNPREKIVMRMYLEGIPPCEIAVRLNRSINTVMNQKARGLGILKVAVRKFNSTVANN